MTRLHNAKPYVEYAAKTLATIINFTLGCSLQIALILLILAAAHWLYTN